MNKYKTDQENFWAGKFGDTYISRNNDNGLKKNNLLFFKEALKNLKGIKSVIEFGSNIGLNLLAINKVIPEAELSAIEINAKAVSQLEKNGKIKVYHTSIFDFKTDYKRDLVLVRGVLIHLNPNMLSTTYKLLYETSNKYILISEYYNSTPVIVNYRKHRSRLFKRDFAGEMLNMYKDLKLVNYGFKYRGEDKYNDDLTWFLLEKK
jgi:pseudaminic acid biosynthesis-associated methylase